MNQNIDLPSFKKNNDSKSNKNKKKKDKRNIGKQMNEDIINNWEEKKNALLVEMKNNVKKNKTIVVY